MRLSWKNRCYSWLSRDLLAISRRLCSITVSGATWLTVSDPRRIKKPGMERIGPVLTAHRLRRERHRRSTCCCCTTPLVHFCYRVYVPCLCVSLYVRFQNVRLKASQRPRSLWLASGGRGKRYSSSCNYHDSIIRPGNH